MIFCLIYNIFLKISYKFTKKKKNLLYFFFINHSPFHSHLHHIRWRKDLKKSQLVILSSRLSCIMGRPQVLPRINNCIKLFDTIGNALDDPNSLFPLLVLSSPSKKKFWFFSPHFFFSTSYFFVHTCVFSIILATIF